MASVSLMVPTSTRSRLHITADRVRDLFELNGIELCLIPLNDDRHEVIRIGRPPFRRVRLELSEAREVLHRLPAPRSDAHLILAALLARDLAPVRQMDHWDLLIARIAWTLARLGVGVAQAIAIADTISQADGMS